MNKTIKGFKRGETYWIRVNCEFYKTYIGPAILRSSPYDVDADDDEIYFEFENPKFTFSGKFFLKNNEFEVFEI